MGRFFPNQRIKNYGIGGDTTDGILNRIDDIIQSKPQKLFLLIGINDLYYGKRVAYIVDNYSLILETLKKQIPQTTVFVQSVLPINENLLPANERGKFEKQRIVELNETIKNLTNKFLFNTCSSISSGELKTTVSSWAAAILCIIAYAASSDQPPVNIPRRPNHLCSAEESKS